MNVTVHGEHDGIVEVDSRGDEKRRDSVVKTAFNDQEDRTTKEGYENDEYYYWNLVNQLFQKENYYFILSFIVEKQYS